MTRSTDQRIIKTKQKLRLAFADMMQKMPFDDITVFELCNKAEVRRATFYRHYTDKYHFLSSLVSTILEEIVERISPLEEIENPTEYYCSYVREVLSYFRSHDAIFKNIMASSSFPAIKDIILHGTLASFKHDLSRNLGDGIELPARIDILSEFLNGGIAHIIISWLTNKDIADEEILGSVRELLSRLVPSVKSAQIMG